MFGIPTDSHDKELHDNADRASSKLKGENRSLLRLVAAAFVVGAGIMAIIYFVIG